MAMFFGKSLMSPKTSALWMTKVTPSLMTPVRGLAVTGRHSKNVAGKKNKLDAMKTKLYTRLGVKILMAAKSGGPDPEKNTDLARILKEAHHAKLPKDNIERALKKATDSSTDHFTSGTYEVYGHGGVGVLVVTLTDNSNRANMAIKANAKKCEAKMAASGSVLFGFDHKAVFTPHSSFDKDTVIENAIDLNIDEIDFIANHDEVHHQHHHDPQFIQHQHEEIAHHQEHQHVLPSELIVVNADQLNLLQELMERLSINGTSELQYLPKERVQTSEEDFDRNLTLIEGFEQLDDVDVVFHNMEVVDKVI